MAEAASHALQTMRIGEHYIPAFDVWMAVLRNGGNEGVTHNKLWATIGRSVTTPPQCAFFIQAFRPLHHFPTFIVYCVCLFLVSLGNVEFCHILLGDTAFTKILWSPHAAKLASDEDDPL